MPVQSMNQRLYTRLVEMAQIARRLPRLLSCNHVLRVDASESVDYHFTTDRLDRVDDDGYCARVELFE